MKHKLPKSIRIHIRKEKTLIRTRTSDTAKQREAIDELYKSYESKKVS